MLAPRLAAGRLLSCDNRYTVGQNLGDSFPDTDKIVGESERIGFGMGQFAK